MREATLIGHERDRPRRYDKTPYGGTYSQEDIKTIVAFANRRHITLVPEIDMPGHMVAAITAYPELGNWGSPAVAPSPRCCGLSLKRRTSRTS